MKRLVILATLLGVLVVGLTSAEAATGGTTVTTVPVSFVVSSDTCSNLPAGTTVNGSGTEIAITTVTTDGNNVTTIVNATDAMGTATDQAGNEYIFNYNNKYRIANSVAQPSVFSGLMTDAFGLEGNGPANLSNGFKSDLRTTADLSVVYSWKVLQAYGDPISFAPGPFVAHCDPL